MFLIYQTAWADESSKQNLDSVALPLISKIDNALTILENGIERFKSVTWEKIDSLKSQSDQLVNTVKDFVDYSSDKVRSFDYFQILRILNSL